MIRRSWTAMSGVVLVGLASASCFDTRTIAAESAAGLAPVGASGGQAAGNAGAAPSAGAGGSAGARTNEGGSLASTAGSDAAGGSPAGEPGALNVTWLSLTGSQAPSSESANAALDIDGSFYAYEDDCATLEWNADTRCASGRLCTTGANFENWGIAIGFDFHGTGPDGSPPDTKLVWNPEQAGVRGVTWRIQGHAPGLQLWVLNMAPQFQGQCSVMTCEIAGPPDGADAAAPVGTLLFDDMVKDRWSGGVAYTYDPDAVYALQFKLPAINVGSASFDFCVEALGVVR